MILGIQLPVDAKVEVTSGGKLLIIFDEKKTNMDLWKAHLDMWVTEGESQQEFFDNKSSDNKVIELTHKNKLKFA